MISDSPDGKSQASRTQASGFWGNNTRPNMYRSFAGDN